MDDFTNSTQGQSDPDPSPNSPNGSAYCRKCGAPHDVDDAFCPRCGNRFKNVVEQQVAVPTSSEVVIPDTSSTLNRDALIVYTTDIVALECEARVISARISEREQQQTRLGIPQSFDVPKLNSRFEGSGLLDLLYASDDWSEPGLRLAPSWEVTRQCRQKLRDAGLDVDSLVNRYNNVPRTLWGGKIKEKAAKQIRDGLKDEVDAAYQKMQARYEREYESAIEKYRNKVEADNLRVSRENEAKPRLEKENTADRGRLQEVRQVLDTAYSANLIPSKFRNIYAMYFINDFMSTSQSTLENTFLHLDLDKIQSQLAKVIQQQQQHILTTAYASAANTAAQQEVSSRLDSLIDTAKAASHNSYLLASYSSIATTHTKTMAYFAG